ncbi:DNA replication complex GINS family protein [Candidatus Bathyarchaeota archaeon]|nr:DNA replication complex GINS family protein [Candidatus Bathyarchaeota archaeon]
MSKKISEALENVELEFLNSPVKIIILKDLIDVALINGKIESFKAGQEVEVSYWIAEKLVNLNLAKFKEEEANLGSLSKIHWRETISDSRQLPKLNKNFYCALKRFLRKLFMEAQKEPSKLKDYEKALNISRDIVNCRIRKIASLTAAPSIPESILANLTFEEVKLYEELRDIIYEWKKTILSDES